MSTDERGHLSTEELIGSVVDEGDLAPRARNHLKQCPECRNERQLLAGRLQQLGRRAYMHAPEPSGHVVLPEESVGAPWPAGRHPVLAAAAGIALVVLVVSWAFSAWFYPGIRQEKIAREMTLDEMLIAEIGTLEENALPNAYRDISPETETGMDDEILDFIVPFGEA